MNRFLKHAIIAALFAGFADYASAQDASFKAKIKPFLDAHCVDCHGPEVKKAGLRLDELKPDFADAKTVDDLDQGARQDRSGRDAARRSGSGRRRTNLDRRRNG